MSLSKSQKSLKKWTDDDWGYISKGDEKKPKSQRGRYLPKSVRQELTPGQKAAENKKKKAATAKGKQNAPYSKDLAKKVTQTTKVMKEGGSTPAWQRKEGKNPAGGLNKKGVASYRAANPGSKLQTAVTTKPSKLKKGSKSANRRKSFCARMQGMKSKLTSSKTANDPDSRINKSLRKWNCKDGGKIEKPRDYKKEYSKFQSSPSQIKKRTELNRINYEKGTYGNGDGLDVSHVNGGVKLEPESTNRGRKEKSRMNGSKRKMEKGGSTVNKAGNYTKPGMRKNLFNKIKSGGKGGNPGQWSARKAQMLAKQYKSAGGGYKAADGGSVDDLLKIAKELKGASKMHLGQSKRVSKHVDKMKQKKHGGKVKKDDMYMYGGMTKKKYDEGGKTPAEKENIKAIVDKINKHNARQRKGTGGVKPYQPKNPREAAILDSMQKGKGFGKGDFKMPKPKMSNGGFTMGKGQGGLSKEQLEKLTPAQRATYNKAMANRQKNIKKTEAGQGPKRHSGAKNRIIQNKPYRKINTGAGAGKTFQTKEDYEKYVSSGQRERDRDVYKKKGKEEVKKASDRIKSRNKSKVKVDDLPITNAEKKRLSKKTNKTKSVKENNNMMAVKPTTAKDFSKTANPKLKKKLDPKGTSGETEKQYQARLKKEKQEKLSSFKPANLRARDAENKPKKVKAKKIETKKVKKSLKEKIISKAEKARAKVSERMAKNKKDREGMRQRRLANKRARKGLSTFDPETGRRIMQDGGMLEGPSHAKGGIAAKVGKQPIEMEGGEYVIKKSSAKKLGEDVLNYLNETGKVPQFMAGGYAKKMYMDGGMVEQEALEMGGKVQDNRAGFTPVYEHGGCVSMSDMNAGAGDVAHTHTHSGYKAGE